MTAYQTRSFPLEDIAVSRSTDGRTVEAFAAVFNTPAEVVDRDGHYKEQIHPRAFARSLANSKRGSSWGVRVFYNHGRTLAGTASERGAVPIGTPLHIEATSRGLLTVTRYNHNPLADEVLESIRNGDITGQSFSGRFLQSDGHRRGQKLAPGRDGALPAVTRTEIALAEYGPTPMPVYAEAEIVGVRALLAALDDGELEALLKSSGTPDTGLATEHSPDRALRSVIAWARLRADIRKGVL